MKRISVLYVCFVLVSLLAIVATSAAASPVPPAPASQPDMVKAGSDWVNICSEPNRLQVTVLGGGKLLYECLADDFVVWDEACIKKAGIGYTESDRPSIHVTCGI